MKNFKAHILIVDDDDRIRDLVKEYLNQNNYLVSTAKDSNDAFAVSYTHLTLPTTPYV